MLIATHDGSFHADETLACAILTYLYEGSQIIRSRESKILETADIIIDVSGINDHKHFDHHSNAFTLCRDNGIKYATAGLMWQKFGKQMLQKIYEQELEFEAELTADVLERAFERIDQDIMYSVDLNDNGQLNDYIDNHIVNPQNEQEKALVNDLNEFYSHEPNISYIVASLNSYNHTTKKQDKAFAQTVNILRSIMISACTQALVTELNIAKVISYYDGSAILVMHERLPWTQAVNSNFEIFKNCMLAVYPDKERGFRVQSLPLSRAYRYRNRLSAPLAWRGLDGAALDRASGLSNTIFVHKAGFTGGANDFESTMAMAKKWLQEGIKG